MATEPKTKQRWIPAPCPEYDLEGTQSWLEQQAQKGLLLSEDGYLFGGFFFDVAQPRQLRYRLEVADHRGFFAEESDQNKKELAAEFGWQYKTRRGSFDIYCCADPAAEELNTEPAVQEKNLRRAQRDAAAIVVEIAVLCLAHFLFGLHGGIMTYFLEMGTGLGLALLATLLWLLAGDLRAVAAHSRIRARLKKGELLTRTTMTKQKATRYRILRLVDMAVTVVIIFGWLSVWGAEVTHQDYRPVGEYTGSLPFAAFEELGGGTGTFTEINFEYATLNQYREKRSLFFPRWIEWNQDGRVVTAEGSYEGYLDVKYVQAATPQMAMALARELLAAEKRLAIKRQFVRWEEVPLTGVDGLDWAIIFPDDVAGRSLLAVQGSRVMLYHCFFYLYDGGGPTELPLEVWTTAAAELFVKRG